MSECCLLKNCRRKSGDVKVFRFPSKSKNRKKFDLWLEKIPKDLCVSINKSSFICEQHFEKKFIRTKNGVTTLSPKAVPTIFKNQTRKFSLQSGESKRFETHDNSSCRFCLEKFPDCEKRITINAFIRKQFHTITQVELGSSEAFSLNICETCFNSTNDFANFRHELIENQKKLEGAFRSFENDEENFCDVESSGDRMKDNFMNDEDVLIKEEKISDTEGLDESFLEENLKAEEENREEVKFFNVWNENSQSSDFDDPPNPPNDIKSHPDHVTHPKNSQREISSENQKKRMCEICGKWFSSMTYRRHFDNMHLRKKKCICDICGYRSFKKFDMKHHIFRHLKIKSFICESCPASFPSKTELRAHLIVHTDQRDFICDMENCSAAFKKRDSLKRHQRIHFNDRQHECSECSRKFHDAYRLRLHQQSVHLPPDPSQQSPCPICQKIFKSPLAMNKHLIYHKPPELKCEICNKEFYRKIVLTTHMKIAHEGKKNFHCKYCSSSYFKNSHLNRHILTVHMKQKVTCQVEGCNQSFPLKDRYRVHINSHHQNLGEQKVKQLMDDVKNLDVTYENPEFELSPSLV